MPICSCPHCKTYLKVKESQLNVAQGFVKCADCQGLFKAKDFVARADVASIDWMPDSISDIELVRRLGTYVIRSAKSRPTICSNIPDRTAACHPNWKTKAIMPPRRCRCRKFRCRVRLPHRLNAVKTIIGW